VLPKLHFIPYPILYIRKIPAKDGEVYKGNGQLESGGIENFLKLLAATLFFLKVQVGVAATVQLYYYFWSFCHNWATSNRSLELQIFQRKLRNFSMHLGRIKHIIL